MQRSLNTEPLLRLEAVRLTLMSQAGPVNILNGVDLKIAKGEAIGLVGPSGSGKSTLLMVMSGLERPTSGKVTVGTQELSKFDEDAAARFRRGNVGIVFQSFHLIPTMTALENVAIPLELALVSNAFDRAAEELKAVGLGHRMDHYPSQLSGGEQQRVALARAIAPRPSLLFADEPTGNLDGKTGGEIMNLIFALQRERGATLILVTHDEDLVRRCDRIVRLRDGRIDGIETVEQSSAPIPLAGPMTPVVTMASAPIAMPEPVPAPVAEPVPAVEPAPQPAPEPEPTISVAAAPIVEFSPEPIVETPLAALPDVEIKPDPELSSEQIESDLGVGIASAAVPAEIEIATPHATASEAEATGDASSPDLDVGMSSSEHHRRVAAGGE
jgi:putative ABC transport system ATP-binding protein